MNKFHQNTKTTLANLRDYGKFLGISHSYGKRKQELWDHIFDTIHHEVNERMLGKPDLDPERAYMEAEVSIYELKN